MRSPAIEDLLRTLPGTDQQRQSRLSRARAYATECGCTSGAAFLLVALVAVIPLYVLPAARAPTRLLPAVVGAALVVFAAGIGGKLIGIGWARLRLALLHRRLIIEARSHGG